ncbi:MAG: DUF4445 domain-containing protein [Kiritimatiellae bacterium]|nr:DUF4445 domain-containing protein [Kiritimatiellia bacterium]
MQHSVTFLPSGIQILADEKMTLKQAAEQAACLLSSPCGGHGTCGKCKLSWRVAGETRWTESLACQTRIRSDLEVRLPPSLSGENQEISVSSNDVPYPSFASDAELGLAVDLGTTSVAATLVPLSDPTCRPFPLSTLNRQQRFGADVIARIGYAQQSREAALELQDAATASIRELVEALCRHHRVTPDRIRVCQIAGNTAMQQLLLGIDCAALCELPFAAAFTDQPPPLPSFRNPFLPPTVRLTVMPQLAGFVGGDTTAAILASELTEHESPVMLVDIGTNGEMALWANNTLFVASTAAGPAFEGAKISCGMRATSGAIDHVRIVNGKPQPHTIQDVPPVGICGSGILDAVLVLRQLNLLDETGTFMEGDSYALTSSVILTQQDIREFQLAFSAIRSGIDALLHHAHVEASQLHTLFLAGAFGSFLSIPNAVRLGLLPSCSRIVPIGNASLNGAIRCLRSETAREKAKHLAQIAVPLELATDPFFTDSFLEHMTFSLAASRQ